MKRFGLKTLAVFALTLACGRARGREQSPFPAFTGDRVYTVGVADRFDALRPIIGSLEKASPQRYYVVVVKSFGKGPNAATDYVDELYRTWRRRAAEKKIPLDDARSLVTAIALDDHKLAVHPGSIPRDRLGLRGATIDRELIEPYFIPLAKQNQYPEAIAALLKGTDEWIAVHERTSAVARPPAPNLPEPSERIPETRVPGVRVTAEPSQPVVSGRSAGLGLGAVLVVALAGAGLLVWLGRRQAKIGLGRLIKDYRSRSVETMDRLDALRDRLKKLTASDPDFQAPILGETLALYTTIQDALAKLWDRWLAAMDALEKAQKIAAKAGSSFDKKTLRDVQALLDPKTAFDPIERDAQPWKTELDRLDQAHETAREVAATITEAIPKLAGLLEAVQRLGLPIMPFQEEVEGVKAETAGAMAALAPDPIGTLPLLRTLAGRATTLDGRARHTIALHADMTKDAARLARVKTQTLEHRSRGLKLAEDGGNPDHFLGEAADHLALVDSALHRGEPAKGQVELEHARTMLDQGAATIEEVKKAKAFCALELSARPRETERLRAAFPEAELALGRLEREFAAASWQVVAKNRDQARTLLATFDAQAAEAGRAATPEAQKYLGAGRLLEELARRQQIVLRLLSGLGEQLTVLQTARDECRNLQKEFDEKTRTTQDFFQENAAIVGDVAEKSLARASAAGRGIAALSDEPRPDWPRLRDRLSQAIEDLGIAGSQAETDVNTHAQLKAEFTPARRRADELGGRLAGRREDRLAANQHFQAAETVLDQVGVDLAAPRGQSARMLEAVRGAVQDLDRAALLFQEDLRLAAQAKSEINAAFNTIRQAGAYFAMGVTVDAAAAEAALDDARRHYEAQEYEQSISTAGAAVQRVRQAYSAAVQQAQWRQMQQQADMTRWQGGPPQGGGISLGAIAAAAAAAAIISNISSSASAQSPSEVGSESGAGSWTSDDGQGSW